MSQPWTEALKNYPNHQGKVREIYEISNQVLLLVATDRISAYDWILPSLIPDKGRVLTLLSDFWFKHLDVSNHRITCDIEEISRLIPELIGAEEAKNALNGRSMLVRRLEIVPFECVVRGYLSGSGWREYKQSGSVCGVELPAGLKESDRLPEVIFTPATKAVSGHDENVSVDQMAKVIGNQLTSKLRQLSIDVYSKASDWALNHGLILADTKFEWGIDANTKEIVLGDEVLTPDSSRYWDASLYQPGGPQPSFDKQFVRDWLDQSGWDHASPPPELPRHIIQSTRSKYVDAFERITNRKFPWSAV